MEKIQNSFEGKLNHEYPELIKKMEAKKYILLIPKKKINHRFININKEIILQPYILYR